jgi:hypothetical protein
MNDSLCEPYWLILVACVITVVITTFTFFDVSSCRSRLDGCELLNCFIQVFVGFARILNINVFSLGPRLEEDM